MLCLGLKALAAKTPTIPSYSTSSTSSASSYPSRGKLLFNHPQGTYDDRFWAIALAVYAAEKAPQPTSKPIAKVILCN
jgi:hypothetical protein